MATSTVVLDASPAGRARGRVLVAAVGLATAAALLAVLGARDRGDVLATLAGVVTGAWALLAVLLAQRRPGEPLWAWCGVGALAGGLALVDDAAAGAVPYAAFLIAVTLPTGTLPTRGARVLLAIGSIVAVPIVAVAAARRELSPPLLAAEAAALAALAVGAYVARCRDAGAADRARLQWAGWGAVVAAACASAAWLMQELVGWPDDVGAALIGLSAFVPLSLALGSIDRATARVDRLLVRTIEVGGVVLLVGVVYVVVVLGFGESPDDSGRRVLGLSMIAAAISAVLYIPARSRLEELANRRVYGERRAPDEPLQTFGARMSRAVPLEELLLQLAESLKKSMQLSAAEVWTGAGAVLERAAAVPFRDGARIRLTEDELGVVSRAHVSGNAWAQVWLPGLLVEHPNRTVRIAPMSHSGELLGLVVCARTADAQPFSAEEERVLTELARQVALALHNSALDTALQASLDDLRVANEELRASRARVVASADESRRTIERNLHDGAQQHLVALAVKLGLARQMLDTDPAAVGALLDELRADAHTTLTELRELAHGIYPPLLMDRGLGEALRAAANRSVLAADVVADLGRFPSEVEAAVYFCCLEAIQNAGKHAGDGARLTITVAMREGELGFEVADDGVGFDSASVARSGHGFVNMADRLGAIGGSLVVESAAGRGTRVRGRIPLVSP